jgi:transcriptional regulator with XRE-family HTH domain
MIMAKRKDSERPIISRNIIKYRKAKGLTQTKLAELAGLSTRMIAHYETNISNPPLNNLLAIAKALGVSILELIGQSKGPQVDLFQDIDMRTLKKIMQIKELSKMDRATIYNTINAMLAKKSTKN